MTAPNPFKVGDLVTPIDAHNLKEILNYVEAAKDNIYVVTMVFDGSHKEIRVAPADNRFITGVAFSIKRFKLVPARFVGETIKPADIKVGDTIRVSKVSGKMTMIHEAMVGDIKRQTDTKNFGSLLFYTEQFSSSRQRINWGGGSDETFALIKAAPERDKLLDRLVGAVGGQTITFRESLARKQNDEKWTMLTGAVVNIMTTEGLRSYIKNSEVSWLKADS